MAAQARFQLWREFLHNWKHILFKWAYSIKKLSARNWISIMSSQHCRISKCYITDSAEDGTSKYPWGNFAYIRPHNLFRQSHLCFDRIAKIIIILGYHHLLWCEKLVFNTWNGPVILLVLKHRLFLDAILARSFVVVVILSFYINHYQGQTFRILGLYETFVSLSCIMMAKVIYKEKTRKHISFSIKRPRWHIP